MSQENKLNNDNCFGGYNLDNDSDFLLTVNPSGNELSKFGTALE